MSVGFVRAFGLRECCFYVAADVHGESLVAISGVEKADVGGNEPVKLREDLKGVVSVDWSRLVTEYCLNEGVQTVFRVSAVDVADALPTIEVCLLYTSRCV